MVEVSTVSVILRQFQKFVFKSENRMCCLNPQKSGTL